MLNISKPEKGEKYFHYYPQIVVVIGVKLENKVNLMPCAWSTCLSYDPYLYGVSVGEERTTHDLLLNANEFSVNFLDFNQMELVRSLGRSSGKEMDKIENFKVDLYTDFETVSPIMKDAYYALLCKKKESKPFGDHRLFVGEVEKMFINDKIANKKILDTNIVSPLMYLGIDHYISLQKNSLVSLKELPMYYK